MAIRTSIFDIQIKDDSFNAFLKRYNQYQQSLKGMPAAWEAVNAKIGGTRSQFDKLVEGMVAGNVQAKLLAKAQERADRLSQTTAERWFGMARNTKHVAANIKEATSHLLRWSALTGLISGLLGAGGLFGIERLAVNAAAGRRTALGLGTSYGAVQAFQSDLNRFVDPNTLLSGVSTALAGNRTVLFGAGLNAGQMRGDTAQVSLEVLKSVKRLVDATDESMLGFVGRNRRLGELGFDTERLRALKRMSPEELETQIRRAQENSVRFNLPPDTQRQWTDFLNKLSDAGRGIESTFIRGLAPLGPELGHLSNSFEDAVKAFFKSGAIKSSIDLLAGGLEKLARLISGISSGGGAGTAKILAAVSGAFVGARVAGLPGAAAGAVIGLLAAGEMDTDPELAAQRKASADRVAKLKEDRASGKATVWSQFTDIFSQRQNNPGNLRPPGSATGFQGFATPDAGIRAMARQLQLYARRDNLDTISGIVSKYAPPIENDTRSYISDVSSRTGFSPGQHLNLSDNETLAKLIAAMVQHEQRTGAYDKYKDSKVVIEILNTTGGNSNISVNGLKN